MPVRTDEIERLREHYAEQWQRIEGALQVYLDAVVDNALTNSPDERELDRLSHVAQSAFLALLGDLARFTLSHSGRQAC